MSVEKIIKLVCDNCNEEYEITRKLYLSRIRNNKPNFCKTCMKKYSIENGKNTKKNMSPERKALYSQRLSEGNLAYYERLTPEEKKARDEKSTKSLKDWEKNATLEEIENRNNKRNETKVNWSPEKKQEVLKHQSVGMQKYWDSKNEEFRIEFGRNVAEAMSKLSPETRRACIIARAKWWNSLTEEEKDEYMETSALKGLHMYWDNISEQEKLDHLEILNAGRDKWLANLTDEEKEKRSKEASDRLSKRWKEMSGEEYKRICMLISNKLSKSWKNLSFEERNERLDKLYEIIQKNLLTLNTHNKFHQRFEETFYSSHLIRDFDIRPEVVLLNDNIKHSWDYGIYDKKTNKLVAVVDLDGEFFHADSCDYDGLHSKEEYDEKRSLSVPENIKIFIIKEKEFKKSFEYIIKNLYKNYDQFIDEQVYAYAHMKFPYPKYSDKELIKSWESLCSMKCDDKYHKDNISLNSRLGDRIITHFHPSIYKATVHNQPSPYEAWQDQRLLRKCIENRIIYQTYLNPSKILQGFNVCKIAPKVSVFSAARAKVLIYKYLNEYDEIFDPFCGYGGRLLGACSLGKHYIGQDIYDIHINENTNMIEYLKLQSYVKLYKIDIFESYGKYQYLFTCPPYGDKEDWHSSTNILSCDQWIDLCLEHFNCEKYVFIVDDKIKKYLDYVTDIIYNRSHFNQNLEYVVLIEK